MGCLERMEEKCIMEGGFGFTKDDKQMDKMVLGARRIAKNQEPRIAKNHAGKSKYLRSDLPCMKGCCPIYLKCIPEILVSDHIWWYLGDYSRLSGGFRHQCWGTMQPRYQSTPVL